MVPRPVRLLVVLVPGYLVAIAALGPVEGPWRVALSLGVAVAGLAPSACVLRGRGSARDLGLTAGADPTRACAGAVLATLPFLAVMLLVKCALVRPGGACAGEPILVAPPLWFAAVYALSVVLQEIAARGWLQSDLSRAWPGPSGGARAVVVASAVFGLLHLHQSTAIAVLSGGFGLLWGELHRRHRTLLAPVVSHALVGYSVIALDGWRILTGTRL